jgi:hypothetical protein
MSFKKNKYSVLKNAISKELAEFVYKYFLNKRNVAKFLFDQRYVSPFTEYFGVWNDEQVPNTYSHYSDIAMETLLKEVKPVMEKHTGLKLSETYSYARIYKKGDVLARHKEHWREEFTGKDCGQVFLHYNKSSSKTAKENYLDKRPLLGVPAWFKGVKLTKPTK